MGFGGTITDGIQDVSALLPLLGTEQCEEHVGSALVNGFLYASASPLSIFGSLGIVRAGFKALAASIVIITRRGTFMGAEKLKNAGYGPAGEVLSQIMWSGKCHAAETQLINRLERLHVSNVDKLTVEATNSWVWHLCMLFWSLIAVILSLTPYVFLVKSNKGDSLSLQLFYPLARSIGSVIVSNMTQLIIQIRLLEIIKHRIVFMTVDEFLREKRINLPSKSTKWWNARFSSEAALHRLELELDKHPGLQVLRRKLDETKKLHLLPSLRGTLDVEEPLDRPPNAPHVEIPMEIDKGSKFRSLKNKLETTKTFHLLPSATRSRRTMLFMAQGAVACGLVLTVVGYVGCFSLVQIQINPFVPVIWLVTEVALSLVRTLIWAWNPIWDDDTSLTFSLKLARLPPLPSCHKFSEELDKEKVLPLTRSRKFLGEITSFTGLLDPLKVTGDGIAVYYTLTRCGNVKKYWVLYTTIHDYKENVSRVLIRRSNSSKTTFRKAVLSVEDDTGAVSVKMGNKTSINGNYITKDRTVLLELKAHFISILQKLEHQHIMSRDGRLTIQLTWALRREKEKEDEKEDQRESHDQDEVDDEDEDEEDEDEDEDEKEKEKEDENEDEDEVEDGSEKGRGKQPEENVDLVMAYIRQWDIEEHARKFAEERSQWVIECISLLETETLGKPLQISQGEEELLNKSITVLHEAAVSEYLVCYEWEHMERMRLDESWKLEDILWWRNMEMVAKLEEEQNQDQLAEESAFLKSRLSAKRRINTSRRVSQEAKRVEKQVTKFGEEARARIKARGYDEWTEAALEQHWSNCKARIIKARNLLRLAVQGRLESSLDEVQEWERKIEQIAQKLKDDPQTWVRLRQAVTLNGSISIKEQRKGTDDLKAYGVTLHNYANLFAHADTLGVAHDVAHDALDALDDVLGNLDNLAAFDAIDATQVAARVAERVAARVDTIIAIKVDDDKTVKKRLEDNSADETDDADDAAWHRFTQAVKDRLEYSANPYLTLDVTEFTQHARSAIDAITDMVLKTKTEAEFQTIEGKLRERQSRVSERLSDEHYMMAERLSKMRDGGYEGFLRQCANFKGSPASFFARLTLIKQSTLVVLRRNVMENGTTIIANALARNPIVSCVDCYDCSIDEVIAIISSPWKAKSVSLVVSLSLAESDADRQRLERALEKHKSILALSFYLSSMAIPDAWKQAITQNRKEASRHFNGPGPHKIIFFEFTRIHTNDHKGYSYLRFGYNGKSSLTVLFSVPAIGAAMQVMLRLNHYLDPGLFAGGGVNITLNAVDIPWDQEKCPRVDFDLQDIEIPRDALKSSDAGIHTLAVTLKQGWYYMRDVPKLVYKDGMGGETVW